MNIDENKLREKVQEAMILFNEPLEEKTNAYKAQLEVEAKVKRIIQDAYRSGYLGCQSDAIIEKANKSDEV